MRLPRDVGGITFLPDGHWGACFVRSNDGEAASGADANMPGQVGGRPQTATSNDPPPPTPAGTVGGTKEDGAATPHAESVRRAQSSRTQVMPGAQGCVALLLRAPRGTPSIGAQGGECAAADAFWDGRGMCPLVGGGGAMRRWPCRGRAPVRRPQGAQGTRGRA